jgi:hypothetical protein
MSISSWRKRTAWKRELSCPLRYHSHGEDRVAEEEGGRVDERAVHMLTKKRRLETREFKAKRRRVKHKKARE